MAVGSFARISVIRDASRRFIPRERNLNRRELLHQSASPVRDVAVSKRNSSSQPAKSYSFPAFPSLRRRKSEGLCLVLHCGIQSSHKIGASDAPAMLLADLGELHFAATFDDEGGRIRSFALRIPSQPI